MSFLSEDVSPIKELPFKYILSKMNDPERIQLHIVKFFCVYLCPFTIQAITYGSNKFHADFTKKKIIGNKL